MEQENFCCDFHRHKIVGIVAVAVLVVLGIYLALLGRNVWRQYDYIGRSPESQDRITVTGEGKTVATPDVANINVGVVTSKATVAAAQKENTEKMNAIVKAMKSDFKIEDKDIKTSQYSVSPNYDWTSGAQKIVGYTVSQSVAIKARDFDKIGDVLAKATELGANSVSGPQFTIDDPEVYRAKAREEAIAQAKAKAKVLAEQVGVSLGRIVNFSESSSDGVYPVSYGRSEGAMSLDLVEKSLPAPTIESGSEDVIVNVSISYEIL